MASDLLTMLVRGNLVAAVAILAVLALRMAVGRGFGARSAYALWAVVPLAVIAALLPARQTTLLVTPAPLTGPAPLTNDEIIGTMAQAVLPSIDFAAVGLTVWVLGVLVWLVSLAHSQHAFGRSLGRLRREDGMFRAEAQGIGPVLLGVLRPRIVLPADFEAQFNAEERAIILAHEQAHLRGGDHLVNALAALVRCLCWFNPLIHLAAHQLRIDQELACDAAVVERHPDQRRRYAEAMLKAQFSSAVTAPLACHWPGRGVHPLKRRIALLQDALPSRGRRAGGLALVAGLSLAAGAAAWAAQPARVVTVTRTQGPLEAPPAADKPSPVTAADRRPSHRLNRDLVEAAAAADPIEAKALIGIGADPNAYLPGDGTPLIEAARRSDVQMARLLLSQGADPNRAAPGDGNPLIAASARGHTAIARLLLAYGADVNAFVFGDETPLIAAARSQNPGMVRFLVERGADVNLRVPTGNFPETHRPPLSVARDPQIVDYLRGHGARS